MPPDAIDAAVNAASQPKAEPRAQVPVTIASTGRTVLINVPADLSDAEFIELTGWWTTAFYRGLVEARQRIEAGTKILVPQRGILVPEH